MMDNSRGSFFDHDIPSLSASLEAFDPERSSSMQHSAYSARSNMNSSRWSVPQEEPESEAESDGPWAPPAWQKSNNQWLRKSHLNESAMRSSRSPFEREITPSRIPLPESPLKHTPRTSPEPLSEQEQSYMPGNIASRMQSPSEEPQADAGAYQGDELALSHYDEGAHNDGFVRFAIRSEGRFRTAPIEESISTFAGAVHVFTRSRRAVIATVATIFLSWILLQPWTVALIPDIANVAGMAKQFEPLLYASENVIPRSRELNEASIAVEDLLESVRVSNMSASETIVGQLDDLAVSLKELSVQLTAFFGNVDSDTDAILLIMEWAKRELHGVNGHQIGMLDTVIGNIHGGLSKVGILEHKGVPTTVGRVVTNVLGITQHQRDKEALQRIFDTLLSALEQNIATELAHADSLFQHFESVDRAFQTLHRSVAREEDSLANKKDEFLASLWRNTIKNKMKIIKYEKNLKLLKDVRSSTLTNKFELKSHIQIIRSVQGQLQKTRRNLISPLIRRAQSNSFGLDQQVQDLSSTYGLLKGVRDTQKKKVLQQIYAGSGRRVTITRTEDGPDEIEGAS